MVLSTPTSAEKGVEVWKESGGAPVASKVILKRPF